MRRYYYSFYFAEGPSKDDLIVTTSFILRNFYDAEFIAQCYCHVLANSNTPYSRVYCKFLKVQSYER